jgi:hypothetical protein
MTFEELYDALNRTQEALVEARRERDAALRDLSVALMEGANLRSNRDTTTNALETAVDAAEAYRRERDAARAEVATATAKGREMKRARTIGIIDDRRIRSRCVCCDLDLDSREVIDDIGSDAPEGAAEKA